MQNDTPPIPKSVHREELTAAIKPLCDLLNITPQHFYEVPGMQIGFNAITFVVPAVTERDEWIKDRPRGRRVDIQVQDQDTVTAELQQVVTVQVTDGAPT